MTIDEVLERTQWDLFWLPHGVTVVDRPDLLFLSAQRASHMLNMVTRVRPTSPAHARALVAEVRAAHPGVSRFQLTPQSGPYIRPALQAAGYALTAAFDAMVLDVTQYQPALSDGVHVERVTTLEGLRDNVRISATAFDRPLDATDAELAKQLQECTAKACRVQRFVARDAHSGEPLTAANMNLFPDLSFAFLWAGGTLPQARGRGAYRALVAARAARAAQLGLTTVGLYAKCDTSAPIVDRLGFQRHGRMEHWDR